MLKKPTIGIALALAAFTASATVLDFEGVQFTQFAANANGYSLSNTNSYLSPLSINFPGYGNLQWSNNSGINDFRIVEAAHFNARNNVTGAAVNNGVANGLVSGSWVAINSGASDVWFQSLAGGAKFDFESLYMSAAWYNGLKVDITAYRDGEQVYSTTTGPLGYNAQLLTFNWTNVDKVMFHSQPNSGTVIDNQSTYNHAFVIDNLSINAVPEPETCALVLAGLALMAGLSQRKKAA